MGRLIVLGLIVAATVTAGVVVVRGGYESPASLATGVVDAVNVNKSCPDFASTVRVGDFVDYPVTISNLLGGSSIDIVDVSDVRDGDSPDNGLVPAPPSTLGPSEVYTGVYRAVITAHDAINGYADNEITVSVSHGGSYSSSDTDSAVECEFDPYIAATVVKTATDGDGNEIDTAVFGDFIYYVYTVTNTGEGTFDDVSLIDDNGTPFDSGDDVLAYCDVVDDVLPGGSFDCYYDREVEEADVVAGSITNVADLYVFEGSRLLATSNSVTVTITQDPSLSITKTATDGDETEITTAELGDIITYVYEIRNTGDVPLDTVTVVDDVLGPITDCFIFNNDSIDDASADSPADDGGAIGAAGGSIAFTLYPGDLLICEAEHTVNSDDVAAGEIVNTATASGQPPVGDPIDTETTETVDIINHPALTVTKTVSVESGEEAEEGDTITYSFELENTGDATLTGVTLTDSNLGPIANSNCVIDVIDGPDLPFTGTIPVGDTVVCEVDYVVTFDDAVAGQIVNTATADSTQTSPVTSNEVVVDVEQDPSLTISKSALPTTANLGDTVVYTFEIANTGHVPLTSVVVTDDHLGDIEDCPTTIAVGATVTCTFDYVVTLADVAAGEIVNTATASAAQLDGVDSNEVTVTVNQHPSLAVTKSALPTSANLGETITYTYSLENTGDLPLTGITVTDSNLATVSGCPTTLAVDATGCTATHVVTLADVAAGEIVNTATADSAQTSPVTTDEVRVSVNQHPSLAITKSADPTTANLGDTITYTYEIENTGDLALTGVTVSDSVLGPVAGCPTTLAVDGSGTCTSTHVVTLADVLAGSIVNTATADSAQTDPVTTPPVTVTINQHPSLTVTKTAAVATADIGATVTYSYLVHNTGDVPLTAVGVTDDHVTTVTCPATTLAPDDGVAGGADETTCTGSYVVSEADILDADGTTLRNVATATGTPPVGAAVTATDDATVTVTPHPAIAVTKSCPVQVEAGDPIAIAATVTNTGDVSVAGVTVIDNHGTPANPADDVTLTLASGDDGDGRLELSETWIFTGSYVAGTADQSDIVTASATGVAPVTASCDTEVLNPAIAVAKACTAEVAAGDPIAVTATVTNPGDTPLSDVTVVDDAGTSDDASDDFLLTLVPTSDLNDDGLLEPGETWIFTGTYTAPADDVIDTATATGVDALGTEVSASDTCETVVGLGEPCTFVVTFILQNIEFGGFLINGTIVFDQGTPITGGCEGRWTFTGTVDGVAASAVWQGSITIGGVAGAGVRALVVGGAFELEITEITTWSVPGVPQPETPVAVTVVNTGPILEVDAGTVQATYAIEPELEVSFETNTVYVITPLEAPNTGVGTAVRQAGPLSGLATILPLVALAFVVLTRRRLVRLL